jgi:hypothetical protein
MRKRGSLGAGGCECRRHWPQRRNGARTSLVGVSGGVGAAVVPPGGGAICPKHGAGAPSKDQDSPSTSNIVHTNARRQGASGADRCRGRGSRHRNGAAACWESASLRRNPRKPRREHCGRGTMHEQQARAQRGAQFTRHRGHTSAFFCTPAGWAPTRSRLGNLCKPAVSLDSDLALTKARYTTLFACRIRELARARAELGAQLADAWNPCPRSSAGMRSCGVGRRQV